MYTLTTSLGTFISTFGRPKAIDALPANARAEANSYVIDTMPDAAISTALTGIIDAAGVLLAAQDEPAVKMASATLLNESSTGPSSILFTPQRARADDATFVNATAAHALAMDDVAAGCHPSAVLMPALLAEAEALGASGHQLLCAYIVGFETLCEISQREPDGLHVTGWHPTSVLGPVGVAAALAHLMRLSAEQSAHALAIAASMTGGIMANFGTHTKALHAARAAHAGLLAARLAKAGVTGAANALEASNGLLQNVSPNGRVDVTTPLRRSPDTLRILTEGLSIKKYPVCYSTHRVADAAIKLAQTPGFDPKNVRNVDISIGEKQAHMAKYHQPDTGLQARYSVPFAAAAGLVAQAAGFQQLQPEFFKSADVQRIIDCTTLTLDSRPNPEDPVFSPSDRVRVTLADGTVLDSGEVPYARGHAKRPLTADDVQSKFLDCAARGNRRDGATVFNRLKALPQLDNVAALNAAPDVA